MSEPNEIPMTDDESRIVEQLEILDDIIYPAIDGDASAQQAAPVAWEQTLSVLGEEAVRETRHEYLRHARQTWNYLRSQALAHPEQILAVMNIILMLSGEEGLDT